MAVVRSRLTKCEIDRQVSSLSFGAASYQSHVLVSELNRITPADCPEQALQLRDVLLCIAEYVRDELVELDKPTSTSSPEAEVQARVRSLVRIVRDLYSWIEYLRASTPLESPPALQLALAELTSLYLTNTGAKPVSLVVPQGEYNLSYIPLSAILKELLTPGVLDPTLSKIDVTKPEEILQVLWRMKRSRATEESGPVSPPTELAILSFAGLDTKDVLLFPLLAHELGHFIDFSRTPPLHMELRKKLNITRRAVQGVLGAYSGDPAQDSERLRFKLIQQTFVCVRELLADVLATRMLGFPFFVAQAEFLKTVARWSQPVVTDSGYPGIMLRLSVILDHLLDEEYPGNIRRFLESARSKDRDIAEPLLRYIVRWGAHLSDLEPATEPDTLDSALCNLAAATVRRVIPDIHAAARKVIPSIKCPTLKPTFYARVRSLQDDIPPSTSEETGSAFAEIMTAAWAYQLLDGEFKERSRGSIESTRQLHSGIGQIA